MPLTDPCFIPFQQSTDGYSLPARFTFPFYYQPHPLAVLAAEQLQQHLLNQTDWQHNFGIEEKGLEEKRLAENDDKAAAIGKMFGVLVVENKQGELGYLASFSGKLADSNHLPQFVPPVFDMLEHDGFFKRQQVVINQLNHDLEQLEANPELANLTERLSTFRQQAELEISGLQAEMVLRRKQRKAKRAQGKKELAEQRLTEQSLAQLEISLAGESVADKKQLLALKASWQLKIEQVDNQLSKLKQEVAALKSERKKLSNQLQQQIFSQYQFLNILGESQSLAEVFASYSKHTPPAGAGECAAPKLLHYAFQHQLKPVVMAEFWWGQSPKSEIRRHQQFYPACQGKCQPILTHMLKGLKVDDNPLLNNPAADKNLAIIYQDDDIVVVNKPAEFLSVPGKHIEDSVYGRIKAEFANATGSLIVHRLDMSTSGLMVLALHPRAHKQLQKQFINRTVEKRYVALLDGVLNEQQYGSAAIIELPLRGDFNDRPRQLVCQEGGKPAETKWQLVSIENNKTRVYLYPKTGRTHQLRVHCAHHLGLNLPIAGDDLYGVKGERLHLHAEQLSFIHPVTRKAMSFQADADF